MTKACVACSSFQSQSVWNGISISRIPSLSRADEQLLVSNNAIDSLLVLVEQESPASQIKLGLFPFELIISTTVLVILTTSSPAATLTVIIRFIPSGTAKPPSKSTLIALVSILYSTSKSVIFILPGVSALIDK